MSGGVTRLSADFYDDLYFEFHTSTVIHPSNSPVEADQKRALTEFPIRSASQLNIFINAMFAYLRPDATLALISNVQADFAPFVSLMPIPMTGQQFMNWLAGEFLRSIID